jgi:hypothetical protein
MSNIRDLDVALRLTQAMLEAARAEDWDRLVELEAVRRGHIAKAFEGTVTGPDAPAFADVAQRILALDRQVVALGEQQRLSLAEALSQLQTGRRARVAYAAGGR